MWSIASFWYARDLAFDKITPSRTPRFSHTDYPKPTESEEAWKPIPHTLEMIEERGDLIVVHLEMPGVKREAIEVSVLGKGIEVEAPGEMVPPFSGIRQCSPRPCSRATLRGGFMLMSSSSGLREMSS